MGLIIEDIAYVDAQEPFIGTGRDHWFQLPYAGFRYAIATHEGICAHMLRLPGLRRLQYISQFGGTTLPIQPASSVRMPAFNHVRHTHVCDVAAVALRIASQNDLSMEQQQHLAVACLTHDVLTPAGGDTTKEMNQEAFDEDVHYPEFFQSSGWSELQRRYSLDEQTLAQTILNKGLLGELLDWSDKIGYMARDLDQYFAMMEQHADRAYFRNGFSSQINELLKRRRIPCRIWKDLVLTDRGFACRDPEAFADFLRIRLLLYIELHCGNYTRFLRAFLTAALRVLMERRGLTRADLLRIDDDELDALVCNLTGIGMREFVGPVMGEARVAEFQSEEALRNYVRFLHREGHTMRLITPRGRWLKPRTDMLVTEDGRVMTFADARPGLAAELDALAKEQSPFLLHWLKAPQLKKEFLKELRALDMSS